jgi:hypothetical protein
MQQFCAYGSVRGAVSNGRPYRDNSLCAGLPARVFALATIDSQHFLDALLVPGSAAGPEMDCWSQFLGWPAFAWDSRLQNGTLQTRPVSPGRGYPAG